MARVLFVDDDPTVRETYRLTLACAGHDVTVAADGREVIAITRAADVIVIGVVTPRIDGLTAVLAIRHHHPRARIIALSDGARGDDPDLALLAKGIGADLALCTPVAPETVLAAIDRMLAPHPGLPAAPLRFIYIVAPDRPDIYANLRATFAESARLSVVVDRRRGAAGARHRDDRRRVAIDAWLATQGWARVRIEADGTATVSEDLRPVASVAR